jgi:hypothetical protein
MTKSRLVLLVLFMSIGGCQPKSEIDKCVEALILQVCGDKDSECLKTGNTVLGGKYRLQCLKAQAGKE